MEKLVKRITNGIILALAAIAVIAGLVVAFSGISKDPSDLLLPEFSGVSTALGSSFRIIYVLTCVSILLIIFFAITQILSNRKQLVSTLIMLAICAVIVLVSYFVAPKELSEVAMKVGVSVGIYQWAGTILNIAYIVFAGVILAFIGSLIYVKIKN
jgi:hypothetical protein